MSSWMRRKSGHAALDGYFPSCDHTQGRPLLTGWIRSLEAPVFEPFHFNLTGTALSLRVAEQLETAVGEMGATQLTTFTNFACFSVDAALEYAQEYLLSPPEGIQGHILVGWPRFAAQLVQIVLRDQKGWEEALECMKKLHTEEKVPTSLQWNLHLKLSGDLFRPLRKELQSLVQNSDLSGRGVFASNESADMIDVGVCYLEKLGQGTIVTLVEPLAAMALKIFLSTVDGWNNTESSA